MSTASHHPTVAPTATSARIKKLAANSTPMNCWVPREPQPDDGPALWMTAPLCCARFVSTTTSP